MSKILHAIRILLTLVAFTAAGVLMAPATAEPAPARAPAKATARAPASTAALAYRGQVNVNTAGVKMLMRLPGIGKTKARRIVAARPFAGPEDLLRVKGIGRGTLKKLLPLLKFEGPSNLVKVRRGRAQRGR